MEKFSIGILSWHSTDVLINTLTSYHNNGLLAYCDDVTIWFQEINDTDKQIATHYGLKILGSTENIGIGKAFLKLAENAKYDKILLLEHDWELIEPINITAQYLQSGMKLLDWGYDCIRYRSRYNPGYPHFSQRNYSSREQALAYHDPEIDLPSPHLLDSVHWLESDIEFKGKIQKQLVQVSPGVEDEFFVTTSRYANWTNNPCLYNKDFYLNTVKQFAGKGIELEGKISHWWARQNFNVAHGTGLFKHNDWVKYGTAK